MAQPTYLPLWATDDTTLPATGETNKVRPREVLRTTGWDMGQIPTCEEWNWMFNNVCLWVNYLNTEIEDLETELEDKTSKLSILNITYPVGIVTWFATNSNPNTLFTGTTWARTGSYRKSIRLAKEDLSDVSSTGGSDTATLVEANLPPHEHGISLTTSETSDQTLTTSTDGNHDHEGGVSAPGSSWGTYNTGSDNQVTNSTNYTSSNGDHDHTVVVPGHDHTVTGNTGNGNGSSTAIDITNAYITLAEWVRTA